MLSLRSKITQAVLGYFMLHEGTALYVNEMARRLSIDQGNLNRKLKELGAEGILRSEPKGKELYYSLNPSFPLLQEYKKIILKTVGFEHQLQETLRQVKGLKHAFLFGSYAANKMDLSSDVDLIAVGNHSAVDLQRKIVEIQKKMERVINVISLSPEEYQTKLKSDRFFKSIHRKNKIQIL